MSEIKIFMCCHKQYEILPEMCIPIQCGSSINPPIEGVLQDNSGENISEKNREYCELTAHYFAWKNISAEYYGFCHYRRFFGREDCTGLPYLAIKEPKKALFPSKEQWQSLTSEYEVIVPRSEDMGIPVKNHYCGAKYHYPEDLALFAELLGEKASELVPAAEKYFSGNRQYFCNMFVMSRKYFFEYCEKLFSILEEFDRRKQPHGDFQSDRADGYLGELFTGIFTEHLKAKGVKIARLPRIDVRCPAKKILLYRLLPPESKRRFLAKGILNRK